MAKYKWTEVTHEDVLEAVRIFNSEHPDHPDVAGRAKRYFSLSRKSVRNRCGCRRNVHFD